MSQYETLGFHMAQKVWWADVKRRVLLRDRERCRVCGSGLDVRVHYLWRWDKQGLDSEENLVTLCLRCQRKGQAKMRRAGARIEIRVSGKEAQVFPRWFETCSQCSRCERCCGCDKSFWLPTTVWGPECCDCEPVRVVRAVAESRAVPEFVYF